MSPAVFHNYFRAASERGDSGEYEFEWNGCPAVINVIPDPVLWQIFTRVEVCGEPVETRLSIERPWQDNNGAPPDSVVEWSIPPNQKQMMFLKLYI